MSDQTELRLVPVEVRAVDEPQRLATMLVCRYGEIGQAGGRREKFVNGAFTQSVAQRGPRIPFTDAHTGGSGKLRRPAIARPVSWETGGPELVAVLRYFDTPEGWLAYQRALDGEIDGGSVGFQPIAERAETDDGGEVRAIVEASLHHVMLCSSKDGDVPSYAAPGLVEVRTSADEAARLLAVKYDPAIAEREVSAADLARLLADELSSFKRSASPARNRRPGARAPHGTARLGARAPHGTSCPTSRGRPAAPIRYRDSPDDPRRCGAMTTTNVYLKNKVEERVAQSAVMEGMTDTAARESRDLTEQERKTYEGIAARLVFLDDEIKRITEAEQGAAKFAQVYGQHRQALATQDRLDAQRRAAGAAQVPVESRAITWGTAFTRSEQFKHYDGHGSSAAFTIEGDWLGGQSWTIEERAEVVDPEPATPPSFEQQWDLHFPPGTNVMASAWGDNAPRQTWAGPRQPDERYPLMDVIGRVPTNQGSIEYMYWWLDPEAMAEEVPEGELKPEAELSGELKAMPVATYAWWKGVTRQALEDIPQIRAVIDGFLRKGVLRRINRAALDALHGDPNIPEIGAATDPLLSLIRVAVAFVDDAGFTPNAVIMNPFDWAAFDIALMEGQGATDMQRLFWNLRPVTLPSVPSGTAYVGDFREAITFFDRRQTQVFMTDSHGDYFIRNKLAILAEARGRIAVTNAAAMVKCEGVVPDAIVPATISLHSSAAARRERDRNRTASRAAARPAEPRRPAAPPSA